MTAARDDDRLDEDYRRAVIDAGPPDEDTAPAIGEPAPDPTAAVRLLPALPRSFWTERREFTHIRDAAHSAGRSADLVFYATLARISGMVHHELRFDTGLGPGSLNFFTAGVDTSGIGKTSGMSVAQDLVAVPEYLQKPAEDMRPLFYDGLPLGSGEGLPESFMGTAHQELEGIVARDGTPKTEKIRKQVRHNAFVRVDEGEFLTKVGERSGSTIGSTIRTAWVGELLGQANASEDRMRIVPRGSYSLGMLFGYQLETAAPLLAEGAAGTPQRFIWCAGSDPHLPKTRVRHPGKLPVKLTTGVAFPKPLTGTMQADPVICDELWEANGAKVRGEVAVDQLNSHEPLMRSKLAALLAILAARDHITLDDWRLAGVCWETSCAVRDAVVEYGVARQSREAEQRERAKVGLQVRTEAAVSTVALTVQRFSATIERAVQKSDKRELTIGQARKALSSRDRGLDGFTEMFQAALELGASEGRFFVGPHSISAALRAV